MTNFGAMNDSYYQPDHDRGWDLFVDYCEENDLDPEVESYDDWVEAQLDAAAEAAAERAMDRDRDW